MYHLLRPYNALIYVSFFNVRIIDNFWARIQKVNKEISIPLQFEKLKEYNQINNFLIAAGIEKGIHQGEFYYDSDLYKWLEAACNVLQANENNNLKTKVNELVELISKSQLEDGYLNTFFSTKLVNERFTNLLHMHELYCAGHLIQAAIAHQEATGSNYLLNIAQKYADLIFKIFYKNRRIEVPGHEEIELALIELYRITKNKDYLLISEEFINRRGNLSNLMPYTLNEYIRFMKIMKKARKYNRIYKKEYSDLNHVIDNEKSPTGFYSDLSIRELVRFITANFNGKLMQLNTPVRNIVEPVGHAVRAMYLYCGMADLYSEIGDKQLLKALKRIWLRMTKARMYVTGGIGSIKGIEGFDKDFRLPNEKSYSETCAIIGNMMWNWRMLQITGQCKYSDLIENLLYNAFLEAYSIDGKKYFYRNPLVSSGEEERKEWYHVACCPPNIARTIASLGKYIYSLSKKGIWIHQYIGNQSEISFNNQIVTLTLNSNLPWKGHIKINVKLEKSQNFSIFLRIPKWSKSATLLINGKKSQGNITTGRYLEIIRNWIENDTIELFLKITPEFIESDPRIKSNKGKGVISFGPLIYCLEQIDNKFDIFNAKLVRDQELSSEFQRNLLNGITVIYGMTSTGEKFKAIPYFAWNNRGKTKMLVWNKLI